MLGGKHTKGLHASEAVGWWCSSEPDHSAHHTFTPAHLSHLLLLLMLLLLLLLPLLLLLLLFLL